MPAESSLNRIMESLPHSSSKKCRLYGQRTSDWERTANPENTVLKSAEVTDLIAGVEILANDHGIRLTFKFCRFHGSDYLSSDGAKISWPLWSGQHLLFELVSKSGLDLAVDLSDCVIVVITEMTARIKFQFSALPVRQWVHVHAFSLRFQRQARFDGEHRFTRQS